MMSYTYNSHHQSTWQAVLSLAIAKRIYLIRLKQTHTRRLACGLITMRALDTSTLDTKHKMTNEKLELKDALEWSDTKIHELVIRRLRVISTITKEKKSNEQLHDENDDKTRQQPVMSVLTIVCVQCMIWITLIVMHLVVMSLWKHSTKIYDAFRDCCVI
eukprot:251894_1